MVSGSRVRVLSLSRTATWRNLTRDRLKLQVYFSSDLYPQRRNVAHISWNSLLKWLKCAMAIIRCLAHSRTASNGRRLVNQKKLCNFPTGFGSESTADAGSSQSTRFDTAVSDLLRQRRVGHSFVPFGGEHAVCPHVEPKSPYANLAGAQVKLYRELKTQLPPCDAWFCIWVIKAISLGGPGAMSAN